MPTSSTWFPNKRRNYNDMSEKTANPAPLGLMGFGMTTVLLNLVTAELLDVSSSAAMIFPMGIFYGGVAQILAGMWEIKKGNTFGATAFSSFGLFWVSLVAIRLFSTPGWADSPSPTVMAAYLTMWGIFTAPLTMATFKHNIALQFVFITLTILFFLLALADISGSAAIKIIAGYEGIICGFSAMHLATAQLVNQTYGKNMLPT